MYYLNVNIVDVTLAEFLRTKFICIIWTNHLLITHSSWFLRTKFICIIWTVVVDSTQSSEFLRTKFICIIWTDWRIRRYCKSSWGLSLFVLFERLRPFIVGVSGSWGLSLFVLFEHTSWYKSNCVCSWGLSLFVLFERYFFNRKWN